MHDFEIGTPSGSVLFDVADLSEEGDLCQTVIFGDKSVTVYPDEHAKPSMGRGLNRPATVRLAKCYTVDKSAPPFPFRSPSPPDLSLNLFRHPEERDRRK